MAVSKEKCPGVAGTTTEANLITHLQHRPVMSPGQVVCWLDAVARDTRLFPQAVRIAAVIVASLNANGAALWTARRLADAVGINFKTVQDHTAALRSAGYLAADAHKGIGTTYALTMPEDAA